MRYRAKAPKRKWPKHLIILGSIVLTVIIGITIVVRQVYFERLRPVATESQETQLTTIESGASAEQIANQLEEAGLIRSAWAFLLYLRSKGVRQDLQAGTYELNPSQSVQEIVAQLTHGKVATDLVTILPGQRIDQIRTALINDGFDKNAVDRALEAGQYANHPALVDKPSSASLEGYLYPESFQKAGSTGPSQIIKNALDEMQKHLTPDVKAALAKQGLSPYEGLVLASIVEKEVSNQEDRAKVAQVFLKRLRIGMLLGSDVTAYYGARLAGQARSVQYDSAYNTRLHRGLPPGPISNVSASSLDAVAHPANSDWLYFVSGDDGKIHYSNTLAEHEAATFRYCHRLCSQ